VTAAIANVVQLLCYCLQLPQESLLEAHMNDCGAVDFVRGKSASLPKQIKAFVAIMHAEADRKSNALFQVSMMMKRTHIIPEVVNFCCVLLNHTHYLVALPVSATAFKQ
jgi:hypothetical protein